MFHEAETWRPRTGARCSYVDREGSSLAGAPATIGGMDPEWALDLQVDSGIHTERLQGAPMSRSGPAANTWCLRDPDLAPGERRAALSARA